MGFEHVCDDGAFFCALICDDEKNDCDRVVVVADVDVAYSFALLHMNANINGNDNVLPFVLAT